MISATSPSKCSSQPYCGCRDAVTLNDHPCPRLVRAEDVSDPILGLGAQEIFITMACTNRC
jgi:hypothetical protein